MKENRVSSLERITPQAYKELYYDKKGFEMDEAVNNDISKNFPNINRTRIILSSSVKSKVT
ncbi:hypothetical protein A3F02_03755 [Candidatus Curtissbacteria bacterium RIFCSPHIGHO2_12_FULL_38_9b]|nr:MAG: hypothetical protein A3F02_03755 [Candidatus Curtissbacteria bacterium RIFCSPHIGHO2_12_FULL_38_9b]